MIDGKPRIGDEVYIHGYIDEIRNDVVIIRNKGGYFGTSDREMFYYEEDERGYGTMNEADRKTEPQYDFGEYADRLWKIAYERGKREALEQTEPSCDTCKLKDTTEWCKRQEVCRAYQPKDEPQTDCPWK